METRQLDHFEDGGHIEIENLMSPQGGVSKQLQNRLDRVFEEAKDSLLDLWSEHHTVSSDALFGHPQQQMQQNDGGNEDPASPSNFGREVHEEIAKKAVDQFRGTMLQVALPDLRDLQSQHGSPLKKPYSSSAFRYMKEKKRHLESKEIPENNSLEERSQEKGVEFVVKELVSSAFKRRRTEVRSQINEILDEFLEDIKNNHVPFPTSQPPQQSSSKQNPVIDELDKNLQIEVLKGQLTRLKKRASEMRANYLRELTILRQDLYIKEKGDKEGEGENRTDDWGSFFFDSLECESLNHHSAKLDALFGRTQTPSHDGKPLLEDLQNLSLLSKEELLMEIVDLRSRLQGLGSRGTPFVPSSRPSTPISQERPLSREQSASSGTRKTPVDWNDAPFEKKADIHPALYSMESSEELHSSRPETPFEENGFNSEREERGEQLTLALQMVEEVQGKNLEEIERNKALKKELEDFKKRSEDASYEKDKLIFQREEMIFNLEHEVIDAINLRNEADTKADELLEKIRELESATTNGEKSHGNRNDAGNTIEESGDSPEVKRTTKTSSAPLDLEVLIKNLRSSKDIIIKATQELNSEQTEDLDPKALQDLQITKELLEEETSTIQSAMLSYRQLTDVMHELETALTSETASIEDGDNDENSEGELEPNGEEGEGESDLDSEGDLQEVEKFTQQDSSNESKNRSGSRKPTQQSGVGKEMQVSVVYDSETPNPASEKKKEKISLPPIIPSPNSEEIDSAEEGETEQLLGVIQGDKEVFLELEEAGLISSEFVRKYVALAEREMKEPSSKQTKKGKSKRGVMTKKRRLRGLPQKEVSVQKHPKKNKVKLKKRPNKKISTEQTLVSSDEGIPPSGTEFTQPMDSEEGSDCIDIEETPNSLKFCAFIGFGVNDSPQLVRSLALSFANRGFSIAYLASDPPTFASRIEKDTVFSFYQIDPTKKESIYRSLRTAQTDMNSDFPAFVLWNTKNPLLKTLLKTRRVVFQKPEARIPEQQKGKPMKSNSLPRPQSNQNLLQRLLIRTKELHLQITRQIDQKRGKTPPSIPPLLRLSTHGSTPPQVIVSTLPVSPKKGKADRQTLNPKDQPQSNSSPSFSSPHSLKVLLAPTGAENRPTSPISLVTWDSRDQNSPKFLSPQPKKKQKRSIPRSLSVGQGLSYLSKEEEQRKSPRVKESQPSNQLMPTDDSQDIFPSLRRTVSISADLAKLWQS